MEDIKAFETIFPYSILNAIREGTDFLTLVCLVPNIIPGVCNNSIVGV